MFKKLFLFTLALAGLIVAGSFYANHRLNALAEQQITLPKEPFLIVEKGTNSQQLAEQLKEKGIVTQDAELLPYFMRFYHKEYGNFRAGIYSLEEIKTVKDLLKALNNGKEMQLTVQFIEGKTFKTWRENLAKARYLNQTQADENEQNIAKSLGIENPSVEGWLAPDTYHYVPHSTDLALLKRAYQKQRKTLDEAWQNRAPNLPLTSPYEMLILASIVEKETALADERSQVAAVFINRLKIKMKLQTDPTVIYGMGEKFDGNIRKKDLQEATPYNTYVIEGLPPTPISMPSAASINAVAHPAETEALYFVANGTGGHTFSKTLAEHNQAVQRYLKWLKENKTNKDKK